MLRFVSLGFPVAVMGVNVLGSFIMQMFVVFTIQRGITQLRPFEMTGLLGGFAKFSAFLLEVVNLFEWRGDGASLGLCDDGRCLVYRWPNIGSDDCARDMGMSRVQLLEIKEGDGDQRLDRWFRRNFPQVQQGQIEKMCRKGDIRVDGGRVKSNSRVEVGQIVRVPPLPDTPAPPIVDKKITDADAKMIQACVLYRDDQIIVLNKPPGLPVQGGSKQHRHVDSLTPALRFGYDENPRLVHRLDKDTSGVLVLGRTRQMTASLTEAFRHRETRKIYWAVVAGVPHPKMGTVKYGLVKAGGHGSAGEGEKMQCLHPNEVIKTPGAKRATTDYAVLSPLGSRAAWIALVPVTGRTHQLRAPRAEMGHPIGGDGKYGGSGQENRGHGWGAQLGGDISKKMHLHARHLRLEHPATKAMLSFTAPLPEHMQRTWDQMQWDLRDVELDPFEGDE